MTEAVYEEIQHRPTNRHSLFTQREMVDEITPENYDVITDGLKPDHETEDTPETYDDVITLGHKFDIKVNTPEHYDDVIINGQDSQGVTEENQEEYDDVKNSSEDEKNLLDSSLALHDGLVRLSGERQCEGEVEVFFHQVWRRVLLDSWSLTESSVACRQLGCGSVLNFYGSSSSSPEHSHECVTGFQCSGSEAHLGNCSSTQTLNCSSTQQLSITCLEFKEIRLTEGCEGNVEVFYNGSWGNVCYNQMDRDTASLICQELNCGRSGSEPIYSEGLKSHNWLDKLKCRRHDLTLWQCPSSPWGLNDCDNEVVKITCSESSDMFYVTISSPETVFRFAGFVSVHYSCHNNISIFSSFSFSALNISYSSTNASSSASSVPVPSELVIVLVVVLLLLLVPLLILIQQNRVMRRERVNEITREYYEDVITDGLDPDRETEDKAGSYDDVITTSGQYSVDTPEHYEDVIINGQDSQGVTEGDQEEYDDVKNRSEDERNLLDSSLALHDGLVRLSGERQCEGEVEVFIHQVWRRVLLDSWSLTESSVVCRQLGCGSVLNFNGSSSSSPEHSHECVTGFQCSGSEAHLGNCSSPQTLNCSSTQQLSITCLALSKRHRTTTEAVYEEIQHRYNHFTQREMVNEITPEYYDDVITDGLKPDHETEDTPESYDDVITPEHNSDIKVDTAEHYDDVIINGPDSQGVTEADQEEYDDVKNSSEDERNLLARVKSAPNWLDKVICRPHDSNLWQCPSSPWGQNDCGEDEVAKIICFDLPDLSVSTTPATTTSASPPVRSTSVTPPQSSFPPALVIVLVVVLLLLLVPLLILIQQNRVMRRALSKRRHRMMSEAVYEEIHHRHNHFTQIGSLLSTEQHSGYEDADKLLSAKSAVVVTPDYYNDGTTTKGPTDDLSGHYDNVIVKQFSNDKTDGVREEYDEVMNVREYMSDMFDLPDLSVSTTPATTTSASPPVSPPVRSTSVSPPQTPPAASRSISPVLVIVLVVVLLLLLVPLLILIQQNRVMRRALSKRRHRTTTEAVYEEIQHKPTNRHSLFTQRAKSAVVVTPDYYNDGTTTKGPTDELSGNYDDVVIVQQLCNDKTDTFIAEGVQEEYDDVNNVREYMSDMFDHTPEGYYDVIASGQNYDTEKEGDQEEYDDAWSITEDVRNLLDLSDLLVSTPATTSASPPVSSPVRLKSVSPPQTPPAASLSVLPVLVIVLVVVLLLLLVPLLILIQQNRVMRRALSKRRHRMTTEAVYEEIQHRPTNRQSLFTQRGSVRSEEQHSAYEDADELLSAKSGVAVTADYYNDSIIAEGPTEQKITPENYNDIITVGLRHRATDGLPEVYDDIVIVRQFSKDKGEGFKKEYDNVKNVYYDNVGEEPGNIEGLHN
ncbi:scavenger receptor cysteine-rich type 1 M130-like protein [Labeo rohita]|uniref:Scavenger receptor cysteine-rich type 1 M130-like protein n=1 Tax=Labeo rohita TaxID=84645 RepID=A0A498P2Z1_LABRO|nr:scavenger receptor cysteine-rich type 1 M130-like protein [Labeo rohita]